MIIPIQYNMSKMLYFLFPLVHVPFMIVLLSLFLVPFLLENFLKYCWYLLSFNLFYIWKSELKVWLDVCFQKNNPGAFRARQGERGKFFVKRPPNTRVLSFVFPAVSICGIMFTNCSGPPPFLEVHSSRVLCFRASCWKSCHINDAFIALPSCCSELYNN